METNTTTHINGKDKAVTTTEIKKNHAHDVGVYAVVATIEGTTEIVFAKTRIDLNKMLSTHGKDIKILGVFKGRRLEITEKVSFNFN